MPFALIPSELMDEIVEHTDDYETIESLSLVARRFVAPSQRFLFQTVSLTTNSACRQLHLLLTESPHLTKYVRSLAISVSDVRDCEHLDVLDLLGGLNSLALTGNYDDGFSWVQISSAIRSSILRLVQLPTIQTLHLDSIKEVPSTFLHYAVHAFSQLTLICVGVSYGDLSLHIPNPNVERLRHLTIIGCGKSMYTFMHGSTVRPSTRHLTQMNLILDEAVGEFLHASSFLDCLESLVLTWGFIPSETDRMQHPLDPPFLPNLRKLSLDIIAPSWKDALTFAGSFVNLAEKTPALEELSFIVEPAPSPLSDEPAQPPEPFALFGTRLYAKRLPRLRRVQGFAKYEAEGVSLQEFEADMGARFPGPRADGILACAVYRSGDAI
ncbi:hypothetical protein FB45DRAFT_524557 [Roridomyces roridus]|uniref:F-box domain-containing protein n=1 Tax=Roridomyces roridus TaxID=1738132 RepID=A0AAD7BY08_9AGAR|nr:hypothetical protein FB45DRAFT_389852 [Roridomyces roridus]KAJ7633295.1 hypothetical protein FB45DRAFT_524557 [Roridomyces roridus]